MIYNFYIVSFMFAFSYSIVFLPSCFARPLNLPEGWFKNCIKEEDVDICNVQNIILAETGQLVAGVSLIELSGKVKRKIIQVTVPPSRLLTSGILLQVDSSKPSKLDYTLCFSDRCIAEKPLTDSIVDSFKKGSNLIVTSTNFQNQPNPLKFSLQGFALAFEGQSLKPMDIDDRQKKIQEFVNKNNENFLNKLKEQQDKFKIIN